MRPLIFVSNDDGHNYPGIKVLTDIAREFGDVVVVAPMLHQSAKASSITIGEPLRAVKKHEEPGLTIYTVNGTPADCIKLGLGKLLEGRKVDLVLSGVNHGHNMGNSVLYSGTIGVVLEGLMAGIKSVAFSYNDYRPDCDMTPCVPYIRRIIDLVLKNTLPEDVCLNVNIPQIEGSIKGIKVTTTSLGVWTNTWDHRKDPRGADYYWMLGEYEERDPDDDRTDMYWNRKGYVTVTPIHIDQTDFESMSALAKLME
jgi:5'-nucleotidase